MDQTLSLYLLDTIPLLDPQAPDYALVLLTLVESILEDPDIILRKQLDQVKQKKMAEMKMEGIEYDQRMEELEKLEYPKPNREFIYSAPSTPSPPGIPWVGEENIRPKSIAREMFEAFRSFSDYIRDYELQRAEGVLLRHLNSVFKVLAQTVPDSAKNDQVREMELYLGTMIRQVDSSLLDEWEKMRDPNYQRAGNPGSSARPAPKRPTGTSPATPRPSPPPSATGSSPSCAASGHGLRGGRSRPSSGRRRALDRRPLKALMDEYRAEHGAFRLDPEGRNLRHTYVVPAEDRKTWRVQQMLVDPEEGNDWVAEFEADLEASRAAGEPALRLVRLGGY